MWQRRRTSTDYSTCALAKWRVRATELHVDESNPHRTLWGKRLEVWADQISHSSQVDSTLLNRCNAILSDVRTWNANETTRLMPRADCSWSITARFFGVPAARFHLFSIFCFMYKCDSGLLKCLFLSKSPIALSRVCWGVYNCLQCAEVTQVSYFVLYMSSPCLVGLAAEVNKTVKLSKTVTPGSWGKLGGEDRLF